VSGPRLLVFSGATDWGGAEIVLGHLLAGLDPRFRVGVLAVDPAVAQRVAGRRPGVPVRLVPPVRGKADLRTMRVHRRAVSAVAPDLLHVNLPVPAAEQYTVLAAVTVPGVRVVAVEHLPMAIGSRPGRLLKRLTAGRLAAHLAVGAGAAREVERLCGLPADSIRPVPNAVPDLGEPAPTPVRPPGELVIGAVGRLHAQKGLDVLVRAMTGLPAARLVLVGDGPERGALERLADELGVRSRLEITGWTERARDLLPGFDVVAIPSRYEGFPLVLLEAMLAARPVVATGVGSVTDALVPGETGMLVPVGDVPALTAALRRLGGDPALRARLGGAARDRVQARFSLAAMVAAYEGVYDDVLRRR